MTLQTLQGNAQNYYETAGYVVFRNLVLIELIDRLLNLYESDIVPSKYPFFRKNKYAYEVNDISEFGYVKQSFLDIHDYKKYPEFSTSTQKIFCSDEIQDALRQLTGSKSFNLMQGMLFDANPETAPHQEGWYLDTVPNGHLSIAWIALEDIDEKSGRFYVLPKSIDNLDFHSDTPNISHSEWLEIIKKYVDSNRSKITAPDLKKGDVLFFNSRTIHGSFPTIDASFSRKSLAAHYMPMEYNFGNFFKTKKYIKYKFYKSIKFYRAHSDYSLINKFKFELKGFVYNFPLLLKLLRKAKL